MTTLASRPEIAALPAASRVRVTEDHSSDPSELRVDRDDAGTMTLVFIDVLDVANPPLVPTLIDVLQALDHEVEHVVIV